jgi:hypothetical protein
MFMFLQFSTRLFEHLELLIFDETINEYQLKILKIGTRENRSFIEDKVIWPMLTQY